MFRYPGPNDEIPETSDAALVMNVFRPKTSPQTKSGSSRSFSATRRFRRTPAATRTTNFYVQHKYYKRTHPQGIVERRFKYALNPKSPPEVVSKRSKQIKVKN
jgi:hypothetical protein